MTARPSRTSSRRPTGCSRPAATDKPLNPAFDTLVKPAKTLLFSPEEVAANRKAWVDEWLAAMSRVKLHRLRLEGSASRAIGLRDAR